MTPASFNVEKEDVLALACHYYDTSPTVRSNLLKTQIGAGLVFAGAGMLALIGTGQIGGAGIVAVVLLVCLGISVVGVPSLYRFGLRRTAEKFIDETAYRKAFGSYTLTLNDDGITSKSPIGEGRYTWESINSVALTPQHLFIFLAGPQGFAVPRAQLPDSTIQDLKAFAESHLRNTESAPTAPSTSSDSLSVP